MNVVGIFGGTFDPIHNAHLRLALEVKQTLAMDELRLLPAAVPPHKQSPKRSADTRLAMLELAVRDCPELIVDARELLRPGLSYTVDTLMSLREELGSEVSLCLVMGADSFSSLDRWHRWQEILVLAHIVVIDRPNSKASLPQVISQLKSQCEITMDELGKTPHGGIYSTQLSMLPISSTQIRAAIAGDQSPQFLLPDAVWSYIQKHDLYR